jgi:DNA-binding IclR family transcriptional regulator
VKFFLLFDGIGAVIRRQSAAMNRPEIPPSYRNQAASRVLAVLAAFIGETEPKGVSELALALRFNKNLVHRALADLTDAGYLTRDSSGERYQLGYRLLRLAAGGGGDFDVVAFCRPFLEQLNRLTGESVYLSIIVGPNRVTVDDIQAQGARVLRSQRGHPVALHCTKMSRVLLAHLSDADIARYLAAAVPLPRPGNFPDPPSETAEGVRADIRDIRSVPFVLWRNPHLARAAYAIFPILDVQGRPHAILTIGGPRERFDLPEIERFLPEMRAILEPLERQARLFPAPPFLVEP